MALWKNALFLVNVRLIWSHLIWAICIKFLLVWKYYKMPFGKPRLHHPGFPIYSIFLWDPVRKKYFFKYLNSIWWSCCSIPRTFALDRDNQMSFCTWFAPWPVFDASLMTWRCAASVYLRGLTLLFFVPYFSLFFRYELATFWEQLIFLAIALCKLFSTTKVMIGPFYFSERAGHRSIFDDCWVG